MNRHAVTFTLRASQRQPDEHGYAAAQAHGQGGLKLIHLASGRRQRHFTA
jgi:hypothetical protein